MAPSSTRQVFSSPSQPARVLPSKSDFGSAASKGMGSTRVRQASVRMGMLCRVGGGFAQPTTRQRWVAQSLHPPYKMLLLRLRDQFVDRLINDVVPRRADPLLPHN